MKPWSIFSLLTACQNGDFLLTKKLLEHKAKIDVQDADGKTALMLALQAPTEHGIRDRLVTTVLSHKPNLDAKDKADHNAYYHALPTLDKGKPTEKKAEDSYFYKMLMAHKNKSAK